MAMVNPPSEVAQIAKGDGTSHIEVEKGTVNPEVLDLKTLEDTLATITVTHKPKLFSKGMIKLWCICGFGYICATINGFDGSLMGSLNGMTEYQKSFGLDGAGKTTGLIFIIYNLGSLAALPFCGFISDKWGRRLCIFIGCVVIVIGTGVQASAHTQSMFIGGRFILGLGAALAQAAAPVYIIEIAHPSYRGIQGGMYNNFWWVGNIIAGWTTYGCNMTIKNSWAWRTPTLVQCFLPIVVMLAVWFLPESPRWLITHDRQEEAAAIFAKYHTDGDENHPLVALQVQEVREQAKLHKVDNHGWDFSELFNTRAARYRTAMVTCVAFFGQWSGNNVVTSFLPAMLKTAGITNASTRLLINAINPIFSLGGAVYGASLLDKLGRRKMLFYGLFGACLSYVGLTALTARTSNDPHLVYGVIVFIYLFGIIFAWGWTPLQVLYPVECLENRTRAKGAGLKYIFLNIASMTNTFGISVGIGVIGWKLYLVFIGWQVVEMITIFFFFPETAGKTLEEMTDIFEAKNPVLKSLEKITYDEDGRIIDVQPARKYRL